MLSKKHKPNFDTYLQKLYELGYKNYYQVLNAKDYGIPQARERIFTLSIRKDIKKDFAFPKKQVLKTRLKDFLEEDVSKNYYLPQDKIKTIVENIKAGNIYYDNKNIGSEKIIMIGFADIDTVYYADKKVFSLAGLSPTLLTDNVYRVLICKNQNFYARKITPKECWRLMGRDDEEVEKCIKAGISNTQLYKQAGNSIVVNVIEKTLENLLVKKVDEIQTSFL